MIRRVRAEARSDDKLRQIVNEVVKALALPTTS
jgi:hypothetical protein